MRLCKSAVVLVKNVCTYFTVTYFFYLLLSFSRLGVQKWIASSLASAPDIPVAREFSGLSSLINLLVNCRSD